MCERESESRVCSCFALLLQSVCAFKSMSVLCACQRIYLMSAIRHVCLFSICYLCVCMCFPVSLSGKYFSVGKRRCTPSPFKYTFRFNNIITHVQDKSDSLPFNPHLSGS